MTPPITADIEWFVIGVTSLGSFQEMRIKLIIKKKEASRERDVSKGNEKLIIFCLA